MWYYFCKDKNINHTFPKSEGHRKCLKKKQKKKLIGLSATEIKDLWQKRTQVRNNSNETESLLFSGGGGGDRGFIKHWHWLLWTLWQTPWNRKKNPLTQPLISSYFPRFSWTLSKHAALCAFSVRNACESKQRFSPAWVVNVFSHIKEPLRADNRLQETNVAILPPLPYVIPSHLATLCALHSSVFDLALIREHLRKPSLPSLAQPASVYSPNLTSLSFPPNFQHSRMEQMLVLHRLPAPKNLKWFVENSYYHSTW